MTNKLLDLKSHLFANSIYHIYDILINGHKGLLRLTESEIAEEFDFFSKNSERIKKIDLILNEQNIMEQYKMLDLFVNGTIGLNKLTELELDNILSRKSTIFEQFEKQSQLNFIATHAWKMQGWYLEFILNYGFLGYRNFSLEELEEEEKFYLNSHMFDGKYRTAQYLSMTNKQYFTNLTF